MDDDLASLVLGEYMVIRVMCINCIFRPHELMSSDVTLMTPLQKRNAGLIGSAIVHAFSEAINLRNIPDGLKSDQLVGEKILPRPWPYSRDEPDNGINSFSGITGDSKDQSEQYIPVSNPEPRSLFIFDLEPFGTRILKSLLKLYVLCTKQHTTEKLVAIKQKIDTYKSTLARLPTQEVVGKEILQNYIETALNNTL